MLYKKAPSRSFLLARSSARQHAHHCVHRRPNLEEHHEDQDRRRSGGGETRRERKHVEERVWKAPAHLRARNTGSQVCLPFQRKKQPRDSVPNGARAPKQGVGSTPLHPEAGSREETLGIRSKKWTGPHLSADQDPSRVRRRHTATRHARAHAKVAGLSEQQVQPRDDAAPKV